MTSGKRENSVHVRLSDEADATLDLLRAADGRDKSALAAVLLERVLLGEGHALRVAAETGHPAGRRAREGRRVEAARCSRYLRYRAIKEGGAD